MPLKGRAATQTVYTGDPPATREWWQGSRESPTQPYSEMRGMPRSREFPIHSSMGIEKLPRSRESVGQAETAYWRPKMPENPYYLEYKRLVKAMDKFRISSMNNNPLPAAADSMAIDPQQPDPELITRNGNSGTIHQITPTGNKPLTMMLSTTHGILRNVTHNPNFRWPSNAEIIFPQATLTVCNEGQIQSIPGRAYTRFHFETGDRRMSLIAGFSRSDQTPNLVSQAQGGNSHPLRQSISATPSTAPPITPVNIQQPLQSINTSPIYPPAPPPTPLPVSSSTYGQP